MRANVIEALTALSHELDEAPVEGAPGRALANLHRQTAIPEPPEPYSAHPYSLLQIRELIGRRTELNLLTEWVTKPESAAGNAPVYALVAIGGMGKSAQAWTWFNQIAPNEMKPLAGRLWWSFYESDATFENFLLRALQYVSGESETALRRMSWSDRETVLLRLLDEKPYLLVLDGLERILIGYSRSYSIAAVEEELDQDRTGDPERGTDPPGLCPPCFAAPHRLRQATDPRAGAFLKKLTQIRRSRVLITTRLFPSELQLPTGFVSPGCFAHPLEGLSDDDALGLWRGLGNSGSQAELLPIFNSVRNHPLVVQALASEVANFRKAPGDFAQWRAAHRQFDPASLPLVQSRTHILHFALAGISAGNREVLQTIVGFRMPAHYSTIEALLVGPDKRFRAASMLDAALAELEDRGLIGWDREANRYDVHPLVRAVVWQMSTQNDKKTVLIALDKHFEAIAPPHWHGINCLTDLTPSIERYNTLIDLGRPDEAFELFNSQMADAALYKLAAHRELIGWLDRLAPEGPLGEILLSNEGAKQSFLFTMSLSYDYIGQPLKALQFVSRIGIDPVSSHPHDVATYHGFLGILFFETGRLFESAVAYRKCILACRQAKNLETEGQMLQDFAPVEAVRGNLATAAACLERARNLNSVRPNRQSLGVLHAYQARVLLYEGRGADAALAAGQAAELARHRMLEYDLIRAALWQSRTALAVDDTARASELLPDALARARGSDLLEMELAVLIALAELHLKMGLPDDAKSRLDEAWEGLGRAPFPLLEADARNLLAEAETRLDNDVEAVAAAAAAFRLAWCDGPPFSYVHALRRATEQLAALGAAAPEMPPFDLSRIKLLPDVELNPRDGYWADPDKRDYGKPNGLEPSRNE